MASLTPILGLRPDDHILTLEDDAGVWSHALGVAVGPVRTVTWYYCEILSERGLRPCPPVFDRVEDYVRARIDRGRWICDCRFCNNAMFVSKVDPLFWCVGCRMAGNRGRAMNVKFPGAALLADIEATLLLRPDPVNRNWDPRRWESVGDLRVENVVHGVSARSVF